MEKSTAYRIVFRAKAQLSGFSLQKRGQCSRSWERLGHLCLQTLCTQSLIIIRGLTLQHDFTNVPSGFHTNSQPNLYS
ncbi:MAG: hypothetical protein OXF06_01645 [Bacteroidetes bacterium]|nr:hypothetical protein [Bacteroidota bacterium]